MHALGYVFSWYLTLRLVWAGEVTHLTRFLRDGARWDQIRGSFWHRINTFLVTEAEKLNKPNKTCYETLGIAMKPHFFYFVLERVLEVNFISSIIIQERRLLCAWRNNKFDEWDKVFVLFLLLSCWASYQRSKGFDYLITLVQNYKSVIYELILNKYYYYGFARVKNNEIELLWTGYMKEFR